MTAFFRRRGREGTWRSALGDSLALGHFVLFLIYQCFEHEAKRMKILSPVCIWPIVHVHHRNSRHSGSGTICNIFTRLQINISDDIVADFEFAPRMWETDAISKALIEPFHQRARVVHLFIDRDGIFHRNGVHGDDVCHRTTIVTDHGTQVRLAPRRLNFSRGRVSLIFVVGIHNVM
jgi:hypothetical protein